MSKKRFLIPTELSLGMEDMINSGNASDNISMKIAMIPLKKIKLDPNNPRDLALTLEDATTGITPSDAKYDKKQSEYESLSVFAQELKEDGLINPVTVYKKEGGFQLIAGERRTLAFLVGKETHILARIMEKPPTEYQLTRIQWHENQSRLNLTLWENLQGIERLISSYVRNISPEEKLTATLISRLAGFSLPHASNYLALLKEDSDSELLPAIKTNEIKNLEKAAFIAKTKGRAIQQQLISECIKGITLNEMKNIVKPLLTDKPIEQRSMPSKKQAGRAATQVDFGKSKNIKAAKVLFEAVVEKPQFSHLAKRCGKVNWQDYRDVSKALKHLISLIEKEV